MSAALRAATAAVLVAASGCAGLVEIEDVQQHLPRLDGFYLVTIARERNDAGGGFDVLRMSGQATLDPETRAFTYSAGVLRPFPDNTLLSETTISGVVFPDDSDEVEFTLVISIPVGGTDPAPEPGDESINLPVRFIAEADYSFCAKPASDRAVTLGSFLMPDATTIPNDTDADCDDPLRD